MATGVIGSISDDATVKNPLGGLCTGIGIGYRAKYGAPFPFAPTSFGILRRIGQPSGELTAIDPVTGNTLRDIQFWQAAAPCANTAAFSDNAGLQNFSGQTVLTGEACWGVGGAASALLAEMRFPHFLFAQINAAGTRVGYHRGDFGAVIPNDLPSLIRLFTNVTNNNLRIQADGDFTTARINGIHIRRISNGAVNDFPAPNTATFDGVMTEWTWLVPGFDFVDGETYEINLT